MVPPEYVDARPVRADPDRFDVLWRTEKGALTHPYELLNSVDRNSANLLPLESIVSEPLGPFS